MTQAEIKLFNEAVRQKQIDELMSQYENYDNDDLAKEIRDNTDQLDCRDPYDNLEAIGEIQRMIDALYHRTWATIEEAEEA